jgi:hypothetical protein
MPLPRSLGGVSKILAAASLQRERTVFLMNTYDLAYMDSREVRTTHYPAGSVNEAGVILVERVDRGSKGDAFQAGYGARIPHARLTEHLPLPSEFYAVALVGKLPKRRVQRRVLSITRTRPKGISVAVSTSAMSAAFHLFWDPTSKKSVENNAPEAARSFAEHLAAAIVGVPLNEDFRHRFDPLWNVLTPSGRQVVLIGTPGASYAMDVLSHGNRDLLLAEMHRAQEREKAGFQGAPLIGAGNLVAGLAVGIIGGRALLGGISKSRIEVEE